MSWAKYWIKIIKWSLRQTIHRCGWHNGGLWTVLIGFVFGSFIHVYRFGLEAAIQEMEVFISYGLIGAVLSAILLFIDSLVSAPPYLDHKRVLKIRELTNALDDKAKRQQALNELWELRRVGLNLLSERGISNQEKYDNWATRFNDWRDSVLRQSSIVSVNLMNYLKVLGAINRDVGIRPFNTDHQNQYLKGSEILERLEKYLEKEL
ncbi:hypothetical protein ACTRXD_11885 [Nitrospira sp. T9]|uniref:hypothetical protein n=1 Tax=unclassified Nitrospira TaxID=2652172 RepID=UPI003F954E60